MSERKMGPNAKALLARFIAREAIPPGRGYAGAMMFWTDKEYRHQVSDAAIKNLTTAIQAIRAAPDNPYGEDEEAICAAILAKLEEVTGE